MENLELEKIITDWWTSFEAKYTKEGTEEYIDLDPIHIKQLVSALIGKCASPTFSGGNGYDMDGNPIQYGISGGSKPIPAEKKEEKRLTPYQLPRGATCNHCEKNECWCMERQDNGDWGKPEPKPKDRIEELILNFSNYNWGIKFKQIEDKLNELIRHINKES